MRPPPQKITHYIRKIFKNYLFGRTIKFFVNYHALIYVSSYVDDVLCNLSWKFRVYFSIYQYIALGMKWTCSKKKIKEKNFNLMVSPRQYLSGLATFLWACADRYLLGVFLILLWLYVERICPRRTPGTESSYSEHPLDRSQRETSPWKLDQLFLSEPRILERMLWYSINFKVNLLISELNCFQINSFFEWYEVLLDFNKEYHRENALFQRKVQNNLF